ncbi:MAG: type II toxin-antitoxin system RelE/ParE family toxin [Sulfurimonas sp.]|jgi:mRNA interferase RelE/StbE|uniref:type II toxin-antitoxin system RelE family toxin n=1 Tax=Sulfurimonas sp. TaxID=2022749 RepID=UPI002627CC4D|nr:type II toxin-antitoxin system RelE/ParE family toxin [Sulfurimonas sp.]MDD3855961.1 type II toxin-antitoxin system RelE/ParE family toxin [Sulfurimonas sp.]
MIIEIRKSAVKDLKSISEPFKTKLHDKILELKNFPNLPNIKKLTSFEPVYRVRVGDYRILFDHRSFYISLMYLFILISLTKRQ